MHPKILEEVGLLVNIWGVNLNCKLALTTNLKKNLSLYFIVQLPVICKFCARTGVRRAVFKRGFATYQL